MTRVRVRFLGYTSFYHAVGALEGEILRSTRWSLMKGNPNIWTLAYPKGFSQDHPEVQRALQLRDGRPEVVGDAEREMPAPEGHTFSSKRFPIPRSW